MSPFLGAFTAPLFARNCSRTGNEQVFSSVCVYILEIRLDEAMVDAISYVYLSPSVIHKPSLDRKYPLLHFSTTYNR